PESRSKLTPGAQLPRSNCCFEQVRCLKSTVRLPFSSGLSPPPPPPPPHMPDRSGWPSGVRGVGTFCCVAPPARPPCGAACREINEMSAAPANAALTRIRRCVMSNHPRWKQVLDESVAEGRDRRQAPYSTAPTPAPRHGR